MVLGNLGLHCVSPVVGVQVKYLGQEPALMEGPPDHPAAVLIRVFFKLIKQVRLR